MSRPIWRAKEPGHEHAQGLRLAGNRHPLDAGGLHGPARGRLGADGLPPYGLSFENSYSGYDSACGNYVWEAQYTIAGELTVDDEMGAEFVLEVESTYSSTSDLCGTYSDDDGFRVDYEGPAEQTDKREYEMTLDGGTDGTLQLTCTLSDDENELECTSEDDADYNLVFGRKGG